MQEIVCGNGSYGNALFSLAVKKVTVMFYEQVYGNENSSTDQHQHGGGNFWAFAFKAEK